MFVQVISSKPQNILLPNLVWWCSITSQSVMCKKKKNPKKNPKNYLLFSRSKTNLVWWYIVISQSVEWKYWIIAFKVKVTVKGQMSVFIQIISSKLSNVLQTWYCDASSWAGVSCKKIDLLFSRSRSQQGLICSEYDSFYYIFRIADPFGAKLFLIVHYRKPECLVKELDCCVLDYCIQRQSRSKRSECHCLFRWPLLNHLAFFVAKLGIVMHPHELDCHAKRFVCYFQGQGYSKDSVSYTHLTLPTRRTV